MEEKFLKLTNAAYKVLEFFPESDPLKNRAKDKVLAIMSAYGGSPEGGENSIQKDIDILLGYFWIGKSQGWLSAINCLIISNEYEKIRKEISLTPELTQKLPGINGKNPEPLPYLLTDRQSKILDFLRKNEKAQVMDLQTILPDVTKRTIRRDLDELLELGKIERMGEFNQVVYKIAQS